MREEVVVNSKKRVLFVSAVDPISWRENLYAPLWQSYLAAYTEKHLGENFFDFRISRGSVKREIISYKPHIIAISSVTQNYNYAIDYARTAKSYGIPVLIGGMHITTLPESLTTNMDVGCIGEGEETFFELMRLFLEFESFPNEKLGKINGIVFRDGKKLVKTSKRSLIKPIDDIPHPKRSIIESKHRAYIYTTRGCPYKCVFCSCHRFWGAVRYHSPQYIIEEIKEIVERGVKVIRIADENFADNKVRLKQIADLTISHKIHHRVKFSCWCRANSINREVVEILKSMNVVSVKMGLESGSERVLDYLKGKVSVKDNIRAINLLKNAGLQVNADFIYGSPEENEEDILKTYNFIKNSNLDFIDINIFSPLPATPVWDYALNRQLVSNNMDDWNRVNFKFNRNKRKAIILSETLTHKQLKQWYYKFSVIRFIKIAKALPYSPWLDELPEVIIKRLYEFIIKTFFRPWKK